MRVGLAFVVEQLVHVSVLQRFEIPLVLGELVVASDDEHGRSFGLGQFGGQRGLIAAGGRDLDVDLHAGLIGVVLRKLLQLIDHLRLAVQEINMTLIRISRSASAGGEAEHGDGRNARGEDSLHVHGAHRRYAPSAYTEHLCPASCSSQRGPLNYAQRLVTVSVDDNDITRCDYVHNRRVVGGLLDISSVFSHPLIAALVNTLPRYCA